jgi:hypothetical protein
LTACGKSDEKQAKDILRGAAPQATWEDSLTLKADVTCDGQEDVVVVGRGADAVWLGVVEKSKPTAAPLAVRFAIGAKDQGAFCGKPKKIEKTEISCTNEGGKLPGCVPVKGCSAFTVVEDSCDPFHFYWDSERQSLTWWRR